MFNKTLNNSNNLITNSALETLIKQLSEGLLPTNELIQTIHHEYLDGLHTKKRELSVKENSLRNEMVEHTTALFSLAENYRYIKDSGLKFSDLMKKFKEKNHDH